MVYFFIDSLNLGNLISKAFMLSTNKIRVIIHAKCQKLAIFCFQLTCVS